MIEPAMAGPATEEISKMLLLQVTALVNTACGTMCGRMAARAGRLNVEKIPPMKMMQNMRMVEVRAVSNSCPNDIERAVRVSAEIAAVSWPRTAMVRRLYRSAM